MTPADFPQANATFGPPPDLTAEQCASIRAYKGSLTTGPLAGHQVVVTAYKPSEADLALLNAGGLVYLSVLGGLTARAYESKALIMQETTGVIAPRFECVAPVATAEVPCGGIIGVFQITGWTSQSESPWFLGPIGAIIAHALPLDLIKCDGKLGAFIPRPLMP